MSTGFDTYPATGFNPAPSTYDDVQDDVQDEAGIVEETPEQDRLEEPDTIVKAPSKASARKSGLDRALIRRVANKSVELAQAQTDAEDEVALLASLLGSGTETAELTVAVMTAPRGATSVLGDVRDFATSEDAERAVLALTMGKSKMKSLWSVLDHLGVVSGAMPASDAKAALALSKVNLDSNALTRIDRVSELAKKN